MSAASEAAEAENTGNETERIAESSGSKIGIDESSSASAAAVSIKHSSGVTRMSEGGGGDNDSGGDGLRHAVESENGHHDPHEEHVGEQGTAIPLASVSHDDSDRDVRKDELAQDEDDQQYQQQQQQQPTDGQAKRTDSATKPEVRLILEKYVLYKTESRIYIVASDQSQSQYRILKIDRHYSPTDAHHELNIIEDGMVYTKAEVNSVIEMIGDGNKTVGGCQMVIPMFYGIVGFVRFTAGWYIVLIKRRAPVGLVGGHYIYHCEESMMMLISHNAKPEKPSEENRLYNAFQQVDLSKNFYFSYSYDLTNTLQTNLTRPSSHIPAETALRERRHCMADHAFHDPLMLDSVKTEAETRAAWGFNDKFMWNHFLLRPAFFEKIREKKDASCWVLPLMHGFVDQAKVSIFGRTVYVTIIARRSRYFAGARFLKRGVNDEGNVANDVETEQIVHEALTTSFYSGPSDASEGRKLTPRYTSYVQHRGSIPLSWQQDTSTSSLKPPIHLHLIDPYHSAAALHFDDLFARYGAPIVALNLIKAREHEPRESRLIGPYKECIDYLNQFLPEAKKIKLIPFDMSAAYKNRSMDVIGVLEDIAEEVLETTKFFHSGGEPIAYDTEVDLHDESSGSYPYRSTAMLQNGVCRTNCIDCLDRTNAAQFVIAKAAFGHQLHALGILSKPHLAYDSDAVNLLTEMYHDHGDTIALQYGGSHLVNTMNTYRKINQWESHSRDMIESLKRLYANVALDQDKQNSINLFLGIDTQHDTIAGHAGRPAVTGTLAVEKSAAEPVTDSVKNDKASVLYGALQDVAWTRRDYRCWFTQDFLDNELSPEELDFLTQAVAKEDTDYWLEYYRPRLFTIFERHFAFKVNSTAHYNPRMHGDRFVSDANELSPFKERPTILSQPPKINVGVRRWMSVNHKRSQGPQSTLPDDAVGVEDEVDRNGDDEAQVHSSPNTTEALATRLLKPQITRAEADEYASYVDQYRNLNLSNELHYEHSARDLEIYDTTVRIAEGGPILSSLLQVDSIAEELYEKHVKAFKASRTLKVA